VTTATSAATSSASSATRTATTTSSATTAHGAIERHRRASAGELVEVVTALGAGEL